MRQGWKLSVTQLSEDYGFDQWKEDRPNAMLLGRMSADGVFKRFLPEDAELLFPARAEALIKDLPEDQRESAREALKRRRTELRVNTARGRMSPGVKLVALVPPEDQTPKRVE